jgi:starch synthase (maltosyl-transferring)
VTTERHIVIEAVQPSIDCGRYPAKRIVGQTCDVEATIFRDGPDVVRAVVRWHLKGQRGASEAPLAYANRGLDRWRGSFPLEVNGRILFTVEAWTDHFATWLDELRRKVHGGRTDLTSELVEGRALVAAALQRAQAPADTRLLGGLIERLGALATDPAAALDLVARPEVEEAMVRLQERRDAVTLAPELEVVADRPRALFGAWYEIFPRSQGTTPGRSATLREAERRLPDIAAMGFDVLYLTPIHPIGHTHRKGRNNSLVAGPGDPGSPWAIGNEHGGHDAIEPGLGTLDDFDHFVAAARDQGLEIALDFAVQCSPDHPWVKDHPEWFYHRPDGTIKYAENPPKKYEDIYPLNFDSPAREALFAEIRRIMEHWIQHGVTIFRVDNPHTKPIGFWRWLIDDIQAQHPEILFLAEAFTRPPVMKMLAKVGFSQSYTYFTWRNTKAELVEYLTELSQGDAAEYYRPNLFANTPDILHEFLQHGGRPAFLIRLFLAATLGPTYGIYSGFELCENVAVRPGSEEYLDSEKYEIRVRDWDAPGNIKEWVRRVNTIRRENPALQELANLRFYPSDSDQILCYGKATRDRGNVILVAVNLDPRRWHEGMVTVPLHELGVTPGGRFEVEDLLTGARYDWGERNYVRLAPELPAHILRVSARR